MAKELYVVGNWKMYKTAREATDYLEALLPKIEGSAAHIYLAVPFTSLAPTTHFAKETHILIGAQNMNDAREGAFTGEVASLMLKEAGAAFVILGHSERRQIFGETHAFIHRKVLRAFQDDIQPILCIGETAKERDAGKTNGVIEEQLRSALEGVPKEGIGKLIVAYEPVWAIGTGKTPTPKHIQEVHAFCREWLSKNFGKTKAEKIPILYGGSVNPNNVAEMVAEKDVDGVLVGGASLDPETFSEIIRNIGGSFVPKKRKSRTPKKEGEE